MYDSRIGRWHSTDRLSEEYFPYSPYNYAIGNPLLFIDINGDYIDFYELAQYKGNLPNYSYSIFASDIDAGGWSVSRYYNDAGDIVGYGAWRGGQFYVMTEVGDLDIFLSQLDFYSLAADFFYMKGKPSEGMLALMAGDYGKALWLLWKEALSDPNYLISTSLLLVNAGIGGMDMANAKAVHTNFNKFMKKMPSNARSNANIQSQSGGYKFEATSAGKVPGSSAVYQKYVNRQGQTQSMQKITYGPNGEIIHIKQK